MVTLVPLNLFLHWLQKTIGTTAFQILSQTTPWYHHTPQPFYGPFSGDNPGEPVPEENF